MIVATYRPTDLVGTTDDRVHPVQRLVDKVKRYEQAIEIEGPRFTLSQLQRYLVHYQYRLPPEFVKELGRVSGGNPLFIEQYLQLLQYRGLLIERDGLIVLDRPVDEINIPLTVASVIDARLSLLDKEWRRVLSYGSVQGQTFYSTVLAKQLDMDETYLLEGLDRLERDHRLIQEIAETDADTKLGARYEFIHALVREVLYEEHGSTPRRRLHLAVGAILEQLLGSESIERSAELADQFERGADLRKAAQYHLQAARNALNAHGFADVLRHATRVRQLSDRLGEDHSELLMDCIAVTCEARHFLSQYHELLDDAQLGLSLHESYSYPLYAVRLLYWQSRAYRELLDHPKARTSLWRGLKLAEDLGVRDVGVGLLYSEAVHQLKEFPAASDFYAMLDKAIALASDAQMPEIVPHVLLAKAGLLADVLDKPDEALQTAQEALHAAEMSRVLAEQSLCHLVLSRLYRTIGQSTPRVEHAEAAVQTARQAGLTLRLHAALMQLALCQ